MGIDHVQDFLRVGELRDHPSGEARRVLGCGAKGGGRESQERERASEAEGSGHGAESKHGPAALSRVHDGVFGSCRLLGEMFGEHLQREVSNWLAFARL